MSRRNLRKVFGSPSLPAPSSDEEDYQPLYTKSATPKYVGLEVSSHSEEEEAQDTTEEVAEASNVGTIKKKQKKKKRNKKDLSKHPEKELDEIDRSVMEVNALLGSPPPMREPPPPPAVSPLDALLAVQQRHLNSAKELTRKFGSDALDEDEKRMYRRTHDTHTQRFLRKSVIVPIPENIKRLTKTGVTMKVERQEGGLTYFVAEHSREYQRMHRALLQSPRYQISLPIVLDDLLRKMHVEELIEIADTLFGIEENSKGNYLIEQVIAYMQYIAPASFRLTDSKVRLEYKYLENRPFHVALLKYAYLLSNRACHRTALELAKVLLNLDPSDPLAVLFVIDTFALRAREHQWLIEAVDYWTQERDGHYLFNLQYSAALAEYHIACKNKEPLYKADKALQNAILQFPPVAIKILVCASAKPSSRLLSHPLYTTVGEDMTPKGLKKLFALYANLVYARWRDPGVLPWLTRNAEALADKYDKRIEIETRARECALERMTLFRGCPPEITRHITVIKPMSQLLVEGAVPDVGQSRSFDPHPPPAALSVDRYEYMYTSSPMILGGSNSALFDLFSSILPHYHQWVRDTHGFVPGDAPGVAPANVPRIAPADAPGVAPANAPGVAPANAPGVAPANAPGVAPANAPGVAPANAPGVAPANAPGVAPANAPGVAPANAPRVAPANVPGVAPANAPGVAPANVPRIAPADAPGVAPANVPGVAPANAPGVAPANAPGVASANAPRVATANTPRVAPADAPRDAPGNVPGGAAFVERTAPWRVGPSPGIEWYCEEDEETDADLEELIPLADDPDLDTSFIVSATDLRSGVQMFIDAFQAASPSGGVPPPADGDHSPQTFTQPPDDQPQPPDAILSLYLRNVLCLHENAATVVYHIFIMMCYTMPLLGAILADNFLGRYKVILYFSIIYLIGTVLSTASAIPPLKLPPTLTSMAGLALIATGSGGIKPCVAAFGGDQFRLPEENPRLQSFFSTFYCTVNLGGFMGMVVTPALRRAVMCFGDDTCYALGFGFPAALVLLSIVIFIAGKPWYRIKQPRDNVTLQFMSCAWYALKKRMQHSGALDGPARDHWLDYALDKYGDKLVGDMKVVCSILYMYLPVPIFWSLFDQQGSRWTFQASRLRSEVLGVTLMPDQLQVLNPALVLLMIPLCPGGACPLLPDLPPLHKMFLGGMLASLAFVSAGILQIGIEVDVLGEGIVPVETHGTSLMTPLPLRDFSITAKCAADCAGRTMKKHSLRNKLRTVDRMFMPIIIGQNSDDEISLYYMDPNTFTKSLTGKPKLKVVYIGDTGPNKNVSITIETAKRLSDIYYVSDAPIDHIGESAFMCLQPGKFKWRAQSALGDVSGCGSGTLRAGGVYVLCLRERLGRLDAAVLHAPNPPNELRLLWIIPQYLLVSVAEIMFAVSGLEFAFTQAPKSMKTITIAAWYVSVAFGNLIVILVAQTKIFESRATEFFVYAGVLAVAMVMFLRMSYGYQWRSLEGDASSSESRPLLHHRSKVISVHSLSTVSVSSGSGSRAFSSGASCLGVLERSRTTWPARACVRLATPSSDDHLATTLAQQ